jgi:hypothetical protein
MQTNLRLRPSTVVLPRHEHDEPETLRWRWRKRSLSKWSRRRAEEATPGRGIHQRQGCHRKQLELSQRGRFGECRFDSTIAQRLDAEQDCHTYIGLDLRQSPNTQWQSARMISTRKHRHHYIDSISMGQRHLRNRNQEWSKGKQLSTSKSVYLHTSSPTTTNSPVSTGRGRKQNHTCAFFPGVPPSKRTPFWCCPCCSMWKAIHAARKTGEVRVIGRGEKQKALIMKRKESRKAAIVFVPIPTSGILEGNERVDQMRDPI